MSYGQLDVMSERNVGLGFFFLDGARFRVSFPQQQSSDMYLRKEQGASWLVFQKAYSKSVMIYGVSEEISQ